MSAGDATEGDTRPTIVFLHATRLSSAQWAPQVAALDDVARCVTIDLPGHGASAGTPFTLDAAAGAVLSAIDRLAVPQVVLVGLSLGGYVAIEVASRWPERIAGLVVAGASLEPVGAARVPFRALALVYEVVPVGWLARVEAWWFRRRYPPPVAAPIVAAGWSYRGGADALRAIVGIDFRARLARYPGPTLLLNGGRDVLFRFGARSFATAPNARRLVLARAGHRSNLDQPAAFSTAIRRFLAAT